MPGVLPIEADSVELLRQARDRARALRDQLLRRRAELAAAAVMDAGQRVAGEAALDKAIESAGRLLRDLDDVLGAASSSLEDTGNA